MAEYDDESDEDKDKNYPCFCDSSCNDSCHCEETDKKFIDALPDIMTVYSIDSCDIEAK